MLFIFWVQIVKDLYYKLNGYEQFNIYYHFVCQNPSAIKWKEGFLRNQTACRNSIITPFEIDNISTKKVFKESGSVTNIFGYSGRGKTTYIKNIDSETKLLNPFEELKIDDSLYEQLVSYFPFFQKNHYSLMSSGEKIIENLINYSINQTKDKKTIIIDNTINQLDDLNLLSALDMLRFLVTNYNTDLIISSQHDRKFSLIKNKFKMLEKYQEKNLNED